MEANQHMVARSLFPFDRTPARTIPIVTKGWLRCCSEFTEGCQTSRVRQQGLVSRSCGSVVTTPLLRHLFDGNIRSPRANFRHFQSLVGGEMMGSCRCRAAIK